MRILTIIFTFISATLFAQSQTDLATISPQGDYDDISTQKLNSDSNGTSLVIWIKKEVKPHKHITHSENVVIVEGMGKMLLGDKTIDVKPGDFIYIPKNTVHALKVTSSGPMKVLSLQSPEFDEKDRVMVDMKW